MGIGLQISVIKGRIPEDKEEPSVAYNFDPTDDLTFRELCLFYTYLKHISREVELMIDEFIEVQESVDSN